MAPPETLIRTAHASDLPKLTEIYNFYVRTSAATFDVVPASLEERRAWFAHYAPTGRHRLLVAERDGRVLGYASSSPHRPKPAYDTSVETSIYLHPEARGLGIGTRLYAALFESLAGEDLHRAYAGVTLPNPASVALHERFGFRVLATFHEVGRKFERYWSVQWFEKPLPEVAG